MIIFKKFKLAKETVVHQVVYYFKENYRMISIDLSKQQGLHSDPKAIQEINFTRNLENQSTMFFIIEEAKEIVLDFSQGTVKVKCSNFIFCFNIK